MKNTKKNRCPLKGIRVLDLSRLIPGGFCTCLLSDAGAEIIKVEEPNVGDYERQIYPFIGQMASRFLILNRNKKSMVINLKDKRGYDIFRRMLRSADVLLEGFRPGTMEKLGLDYDSIRKENDRLIYCSISSFGQNGPLRDIVAHDINIMGMAGYFDMAGEREQIPEIPGIQIADSISAMYAAFAILVALINREKTGEGQYIDISMFDGVMSWMFDAARYIFAGMSVPGNKEGRLLGGFPNYNLYQTKDGKYIAVGSLEAKFRRVLLEKLGGDKYIDEEMERTSSQFKKSDRILFEFLRNKFVTKTRDEWVKELGELNICVSPVNSVEEALSHPQTIARKMVIEVDHPSTGRIKQIGSAIKYLNIKLDINSMPAPCFGEHTKEIMRMIGYTKDEIDDLICKGIICC